MIHAESSVRTDATVARILGPLVVEHGVLMGKLFEDVVTAAHGDAIKPQGVGVLGVERVRRLSTATRHRT
jgi:hypothetical protein